MKVARLMTAMMFLTLGGCASVKTAVQPSWLSPAARRVAVLPFKGDPDFADQMSDVLVTELVGHGYNVVERTDLTSIVQEHSLQYTGAFDSRTVTQTGQLAGADLIVLGTVSTRRVVPPLQWFFGTGDAVTQIDSVTVRWVSVRSGQVVASARFRNPWGGNPEAIASRIVQAVDGAIQANATARAAATAARPVFAALPDSN